MTIAAPKPGTPGFRALEAIVAHPDELGPEEIAGMLWPMDPLPPATPIGPEGYRVWAMNRRRLWDRRDEEEASRRARAARLLGRLQELGLVEPRGAPRLAAWWPARVAERGLHAAVEGLLFPDRSRLLDEEEDEQPEQSAKMRRALELVLEVGKSPESAAAARGGRDGTTGAAWAALVEAGIVVAGGKRRATPAGAALVRGR